MSLDWGADPETTPPGKRPTSEVINNDVRNFTSRKKAEAFLLPGKSAGDPPPLLRPVAYILKDGSAPSLTDLAVWGYTYSAPIICWLNNWAP